MAEPQVLITINNGGSCGFTELEASHIQPGSANNILRTNATGTASEWSTLPLEAVPPGATNTALTTIGTTVAFTKLAPAQMSNVAATYQVLASAGVTNQPPSYQKVVNSHINSAVAGGAGRLLTSDGASGTVWSLPAAVAATGITPGAADTVLQTNAAGTAAEWEKINPLNMTPGTANTVLSTDAAGTTVSWTKLVQYFLPIIAVQYTQAAVNLAVTVDYRVTRCGGLVNFLCQEHLLGAMPGAGPIDFVLPAGFGPRIAYDTTILVDIDAVPTLCRATIGATAGIIYNGLGSADFTAGQVVELNSFSLSHGSNQP